MKVCKIENCDRKYHARDYCEKHYQKFRIKGVFLDLNKNFKVCSIKGCNNRNHARDYCEKHYNHFKKQGGFLKLERKVRTCKLENCNKKHYGNGYCQKHWSQLDKYGKILNRTKFDKNEIIIKGEIAEIILYNSKHKEIARTIIDAEDIDKIKKHKWCLNKHSGGYPITRMGKKIVLLSRYLLNAEEHIEVDHINHDPFDNRRSNLRRCTRLQNAKNVGGPHRDNSSKYKGVSKNNNRWRARICVNGVTIELGSWDSEEHSAAIYNEAAAIYHGAFACLNDV